MLVLTQSESCKNGSVTKGKQICVEEMVGTARFELATSRTPSVRATRLRYVPTATLKVSLAFQKRQETAQSIAQIEQHFAA
jgi:hypothetical protein